MPLNPDLADFLELANQNSQPSLQQQGAELARENYNNSTLFLDGECEVPYQDYDFNSSDNAKLNYYVVSNQLNNKPQMPQPLPYYFYTVVVMS